MVLCELLTGVARPEVRGQESFHGAAGLELQVGPNEQHIPSSRGGDAEYVPRVLKFTRLVTCRRKGISLYAPFEWRVKPLRCPFVELKTSYPFPLIQHASMGGTLRR